MATSAAADAAPLSYKERVVRLYSLYAPDKLPSVDEALLRYAGREPTMMAMLVAKYGPEPNGAAPRAADAAASSYSSAAAATGTGEASRLAAFRGRVTRFYQHYAPDKISVIDKAVTAYAGREEELMLALTEKYGPEPAEGQPMKTNPPSSTPSPPPPSQPVAIVSPLSPAIDAAEASPAATYSEGTAALRARLVRFYEQYAPDKLSVVDQAVAMYADNPEELFAILKDKYGAEPPEVETAVPSPGTPQVLAGSTPAIAAAASSPASDSASQKEAAATVADYRRRLERFYRHYDATKLAVVDDAMARFVGREDAMMALVVAKYGPEPAADTDGDGSRRCCTAAATAATAAFRCRCRTWIGVSSRASVAFLRSLRAGQASER
jgi:hypothetical protein